MGCLGGVGGKGDVEGYLNLREWVVERVGRWLGVWWGWEVRGEGIWVG